MLMNLLESQQTLYVGMAGMCTEMRTSEKASKLTKHKLLRLFTHRTTTLTLAVHGLLPHLKPDKQYKGCLVFLNCFLHLTFLII